MQRDSGSTSPGPVIGAALVLGAASLWGTFGIFAKYLYAAGFETVELASVRAAVAFIGVALFALINAARGRGSVRVPLRALPFFAAYGILGFAFFELVFFASMEHTSVAVAVALLYTAPAFVVFMSALLWRERVDRTRVVSLVMILCGVLLVTGAAGALVRGTATLSARALLLGLGAGFGYALYTMFSKVAMQRHDAVTSLFWSFLFAAIPLAIAASPVSPFVRAPEHTLLLVMLGIVPTILPYALYLAALRALRASTAAMLASLEPVVAALLAWALLSEGMDAVQAAGMALVVGAAVILARTEAGRAEG
ncbi:MAG TPA: DMT family transporter [Longimicrobiales bacterium]|nr:DMT family transporter [Longimicrobiales bacterium]